jgi:hypothetical protein
MREVVERGPRSAISFESSAARLSEPLGVLRAGDDEPARQVPLVEHESRPSDALADHQNARMAYCVFRSSRYPNL